MDYKYDIGRHVTVAVPSPFEEWEFVTFSGFVRRVTYATTPMAPYYDIDGDTPPAAVTQTTIVSVKNISEWFVWPIEEPLKYLALNGRLVLKYDA